MPIIKLRGLQKNVTSRFALTFLLRNRCRSALDMFQVRVTRRYGAFFVFKRCQRPAGGRGDYHRHRFNFAQMTVRSRSCHEQFQHILSPQKRDY